MNSGVNKNLESSSSSSIEDNNSQVCEPESTEIQTIDVESLLEVWRKYATLIEKENARLFSILTNQLPELENGTQIFLKLKSTIQEGEISKGKANLLAYLKSELKNNNIQLSTSVEEEMEASPHKAFTAADKLQVMMQKNPALALLKKQFNLDLD